MNRRRHLQLVALEARDVPAVALPAGLLASSGLYMAGGDVVAGVINGKPAYVNIANGAASSVTVLPSLSVAANGAGGNPAGAVQDVIRNAVGETIFVGSSQSDTSNANGLGETSTWAASTANVPVGYGYGSSQDVSYLLSGSPTQVFVGGLSGIAIVVANGTVQTLPSGSTAGGTIALAISSNSNYIVGVDGTHSVAWKKNSAGTYELVNLQAPTSGGPRLYVGGREQLRGGAVLRPGLGIRSRGDLESRYGRDGPRFQELRGRR